MGIVPTKQCVTCGVTQPVGNFYASKDANDGLRGRCKQCHAEYRDKRRGPKTAPPTFEERLWSKVQRGAADDCWIWTAAASLNIWIDGEGVPVRRYLWERGGGHLAQGDRVIAICHHVRCVNPAHLDVLRKGKGARDGFKVCSMCQQEKVLAEFSPCSTGTQGRSGYCKPCAREDKRRYAKKNPAIVRSHRLAKYGLTPTAYATKLQEQGSVCAICGELHGLHGLGIDHDHATGVVRGLLCSRCNAGIAMFLHDPGRLQSAIDYLAKWDGIITHTVRQLPLEAR